MATSSDFVIARIISEILSQARCVTPLMSGNIDTRIIWPAKMLAQEMINDAARL